MPTIGVYIPMKVARAVARVYDVQVGDKVFLEIVRSITAEALDQEAGVSYQEHAFLEDCENEDIHRRGRRCRACGGSY